MIIAYWNSGFFNTYGGAEFHAAEMLNQLAGQGETCFLLTDNREQGGGSVIKPELDERIGLFQGAFTNPMIHSHNPIRFLYQLSAYLWSTLRLAAWLSGNRVDVIHQHFAGVDVVMLSLLKKLFGFRFVVTFHGLELELAEESALSDWKNRLALSSADHVTAVSSKLADRLRVRYPKSHIHFIPIGIDLDEIRALSKQPSELPIQPGHFVYCGRIDPEKQVPGLVEAFALAIGKGCGRNLYIMGNGADERRVRSLLTSLHVHDRVFLLGAHKRHQALRMISGSYCLLLNSSSEGCPLVIWEALALGKPVIAPDVGGIGELVSHDQDAMLFPAGDKQALSSAILALDKDESLAEKLGRNAFATASRHTGVQATIDAYMELYRPSKSRERKDGKGKTPVR